MKVAIELPWHHKTVKKFAEDNNLEIPVNTLGKTVYDYVLINIETLDDTETLFKILNSVIYEFYGGMSIRESRGLFDEHNKIDWVIEEKDIYYE